MRIAVIVALLLTLGIVAGTQFTPRTADSEPPVTNDDGTPMPPRPPN